MRATQSIVRKRFIVPLDIPPFRRINPGTLCLLGLTLVGPAQRLPMI
jgi:hypothetical protein